MDEEVILVDENDVPVGRAGKQEAHERALLHRAFSIFIFNPEGLLMLQRRAQTKYHSGGLWTNPCCGHPRPDEGTEDAAHRRLKEEMGFDCPLTELYSFTYTAPFENGLAEHEFDHVFVGTWNGSPVLNPAEADDWKWIGESELREDLARNRESYTYWFRIAFEDTLKKAKGRGLFPERF